MDNGELDKDPFGLQRRVNRQHPCRLTTHILESVDYLRLAHQDITGFDRGLRPVRIDELQFTIKTHHHLFVFGVVMWGDLSIWQDLKVRDGQVLRSVLGVDQLTPLNVRQELKRVAASVQDTALFHLLELACIGVLPYLSSGCRVGEDTEQPRRLVALVNKGVCRSGLDIDTVADIEVGIFVCPVLKSACPQLPERPLRRPGG